MIWTSVSMQSSVCARANSASVRLMRFGKPFGFVGICRLRPTPMFFGSLRFLDFAGAFAMLGSLDAGVRYTQHQTHDSHMAEKAATACPNCQSPLGRKRTTAWAASNSIAV